MNSATPMSIQTANSAADAAAAEDEVERDGGDHRAGTEAGEHAHDAGAGTFTQQTNIRPANSSDDWRDQPESERLERGPYHPRHVTTDDARRSTAREHAGSGASARHEPVRTAAEMGGLD